MNVLVTDGDERPALAVTRSLGRHGIQVIVGHDRPRSLAGASRYCAGTVTYPSPYTHPEAFIDFLVGLVRRQHIDVVLPVTDVTTHAVAGAGETLARYTTTASPALAQFELAADKHHLLQRASRCGIPIPRTQFLDNFRELPGALSRLTYPVVVKPGRSRIRKAGGWIATSVRYAHNQDELLRLYRETPHLAAHPSLLQDRIVGSGLGLFVLCDRGRILTAFAHRRLREKPPSGGVSVLCESTAVDPVLYAQAERLLTPLGWHGVAMLEYKQDERTGARVLMEVNGRFWGSLQLAVDAGVDFPYLAWRLARGQTVEPPDSYRVGVRTRWFLGDVDHLLARWRNDARDMPHDAPSPLATVFAFLRSCSPRTRSEIARLDDPAPALEEVRTYLGAIAHSMGSRLRTRAFRRAPAMP
jgi:predicted ATP-grasp superfamily ATP-dependent carboligase